ncbi:hypothetical protein LSG31_17380 [Fodinisporobacter ferrooxydans]|uniref:Carboxymuconolactone decarboxylase-like domain-containing protein n=1 Tax=Fodinisporobacter ferrooxydans TaxID=2901836 RepID=A0ABY4CGJ7_9BACL|nr:hypothetical protein LSG31_17380 [Alicyclobacillaceae bacterium MYW30-H2]
MTRISGVSQETAQGFIREVFDAQLERYGKVLENHKLYARRPSIFKAVRGMWAGLEESGLIPEQLVALVNIRVANLNGCPF